MNANLRPRCWEIPAERLIMLRWCRAQEPTGWRALWLRIARAWRA